MTPPMAGCALDMHDWWCDLTLLPDSEDPRSAAAVASLVAIAEAAGRIAMPFFEPGGATRAEVEWKGDGTPVTEADYAVNLFLETALPPLWPGAAWLSEESTDNPARLDASQVIIVDPIDGTRGFARGDRHWAIAIALVERGRPVVGIVHAPALGETYLAVAGQGASLNGEPLRLREPDPAYPSALSPETRITCPNATAVALREAGVDFAFQPKIASLALRIVKIASGFYDAGLASRNAHDWDLAAADLVLQEAGGILSGLDGHPLVYNGADPTHGALIATARGLQASLREAIARTPFGRA